MADVRTRIAMARQRFGKMRHIWSDKVLHLNLRLRLYKACVCSIMTYGSEAWNITTAVKKALNGANAGMMSIITGKTQQQEASPKWRTYDMVRGIRARRLQWLGHVLRMGSERKLKQAVYEMYVSRTEGDLMMDAPATESWHELQKYAKDKDYWRARVRKMKQPRLRVEFHSDTTTKTTRRTADTTTPTPTPTTLPTEQPTETENESNARKYKERDEHEMFFREGRARKQPTRKCKKTKPRPLTDKERAAFARAHYELHHGSNNNNSQT